MTARRLRLALALLTLLLLCSALTLLAYAARPVVRNEATAVPAATLFAQPGG